MAFLASYMIHTHGDMHLAMQRVQADTGAMTGMYLTRLVTRHLSHATLVGLPRLLRAYMHPPPFYLHPILHIYCFLASNPFQCGGCRQINPLESAPCENNILPVFGPLSTVPAGERRHPQRGMWARKKGGRLVRGDGPAPAPAPSASRSRSRRPSRKKARTSAPTPKTPPIAAVPLPSGITQVLPRTMCLACLSWLQGADLVHFEACLRGAGITVDNHPLGEPTT